MSEYELTLSKLSGVKPISNGFQATCPCHEDLKQSLSVSEGRDGRVLLYCHAGCQYGDIVRKLDIRPEKPISPVEPQIQTIYDYTDIDGKLLYQVVRYVPKSFKQRRPDGKGDWIWDLKGINHTLYHLPELVQAVKDARPILITEGEKDVDRLRELGQIATTISGGANSKWPSSLIPLFDNATVYIIPDKDEAGHKYAEYVASILHGWTAVLKIVELPCKDAADYLINHKIDDLYKLVVSAPLYRASNIVTRDEFEVWKGVNRWLFKQLVKKKSNRGLYDSV